MGEVMTNLWNQISDIAGSRGQRRRTPRWRVTMTTRSKSGWAETRTSTAIATRTMMRTEAEMMKTTEVMDRYCCDLHSPVSGYLLLYPIYFKKNLHLNCLNLNN